VVSPYRGDRKGLASGAVAGVVSPQCHKKNRKKKKIMAKTDMLNRNLTNKLRFGAFFIPYGRLQPLKIDPS
jgi:hypothetical protein